MGCMQFWGGVKLCKGGGCATRHTVFQNSQLVGGFFSLNWGFLIFFFDMRPGK